MSVRKGMSILDLLPWTTGFATAVPDNIVEQIGVLTILDHRATTSLGAYLHQGTLQSVADALDINTANWGLRIPGLTHGLPFRLAITRPGLAPAPAAGTPVPLVQEAAPVLWAIDIEVREVEALIPFVRAATPVAGAGLSTPTLQAVAGNAQQQRVYLCTRGVLRISGGGPAGAQVQIVDTPDPFDPAAPSGSVVRADVRPSSFLFGTSQYGMTIDKILVDLSPTYTPAEVEARSHDETWQGLSLKESMLYLPVKTPLVDNVVVGVRDLVIGSPFGMQGELSVDLGKDFKDALKGHIKIEYKDDDGDITEQAPEFSDPNVPQLVYVIKTAQLGTTRRARAKFDIHPGGGVIPGFTDMKVLGVWWEVPGGTEGNSAVTPWFDAPTTAVLRYRLRVGDPNPNVALQPSLPSAIPDKQSELPEVTVSFPRETGTPSGVAPLIDATIDGVVYHNVLHLRGPRARLEGIEFNTRPKQNFIDLVRWQMGTGSAPVNYPAVAKFKIPKLDPSLRLTEIVISNADGRRRIRIDIIPFGPLSIGHQLSASEDSHAVVTVSQPGQVYDATPSAVVDTFRSFEYHLDGSRSTAPEQAKLVNSNEVELKIGTDAEVEVPLPTGDDDPVPMVTRDGVSRGLQIGYEWATATPVHVVYPYEPKDPYGQPKQLPPNAPLHEEKAYPLALEWKDRKGPDSIDPSTNLLSARIARWVNVELPLPPAGQTRKYYVVGRTDDLWYASDKDHNNKFNQGLATARLNAAVKALKDAGVLDSAIVKRIESDPAPSNEWPAALPERIWHVGRLALPSGKIDNENGIPVWRQFWLADGVDGVDGLVHAKAREFPEREPYRSSEIFALDSDNQLPPPPPGIDKKTTLVRMLVPGKDGMVPAMIPETPGTKLDYRVRVRVKWDSPTVASPGDAIPTEAEALVRWRSAEIVYDPGKKIPPPSGSSTNFWEVLLRWAYDARTGQTEASGALSMPDGTLHWDNDFLAGALAFGPALASVTDKIIQDDGVQFAAALGLLAASGAIGELINQGDGKDSCVDIDKITISYKWNGTPHVAATLDYTIELRVNVAVAGASLTGQLRLAYKGVGLYFDGAPGGGLDKVGLRYEELDVQVVDPGTWSLGGPLGDLIRIAAARIGNGSSWMEYDLEFALDLGVVRLENSTIRAGITPFSIELRGLTASVDIPGTLKGKGSMSIGDGGSVRALIALEVIPAKLSAYGALAVQKDFVSVEVGVQLPVGIPLGGTGFGIFGFMGRFVANGKRDLSKVPDEPKYADPVQKQLGWYELEPQDKYAPYSGQYAFGVGAVIGTLPDSGFTFNAEGSLTIGFPDISVVFAIDAHLISQRKGKAEAKGKPNSSETRILGMVVIEPDSVMIGVRTKYVIPKVLELGIPFSAFFPLAGSGKAWYMRVGTDNHPDRPGDPITLTLLPDVLDVHAWAFVLIEEKALPGLGGNLIPPWADVPKLDFTGFSIGVGAGFDLKWTADPFSLEIDAFLVVGLGTKPLLFAGAAGIKGELDLVVITVGVDGVIHFKIQKGHAPYAHGIFCGHVDCLLFTVEGCVEIEIGKQKSSDIPKPDSPLAGIDLCDRLAVVKGKATTEADADYSTVWPDTVAVLKFNHPLEDASSAQTDFVRKLKAPAMLTPWSGSTELRYAYRLKTVELYRQDKATSNWGKVSGPMDSAWWLPVHRKGIIEDDPDSIKPSTEEGRELGLFSWSPWAWARWLTAESMDVPGNPANSVPSDLCDKVEPADLACAYGKDRVYGYGTFGRFKAQPLPSSAFPSNFSLYATLPDGLGIDELVNMGADIGWNWTSGAVSPLHGTLTHHNVLVKGGWRLPGWKKQGKVAATAPIALHLTKPLLDGELVLEVCANAGVVKSCDKMPKEDGPYTGFTGASDTRYVGPSMRCYAIGNERALMLGGGQILGDYPGLASEVSVDIDPQKGSVTLIAKSTSGGVLGTAITTSTGGRQWIKVAANGISSMELKSTAQPILFEVCWTTTMSSLPTDGRPPLFERAGIEPLDVPRIKARDGQGKVVVLEGKPMLGGEPVLTRLPATCPKWRFSLPPSNPGWTQLDIAPWTKGEVSLVVLCGATTEAVAAQQGEQEFEDSLVDLLKDLVDAAKDNQPTHEVYLEADTLYEIRVSWQWQGWRPKDPGDDPPVPVDSDRWDHNPTETEIYRFRTAAFKLADAPPPPKNTSLDLDPSQGGPAYDERGFDPRGISRYLTHVNPTHEDPPHFLDDPIGFWFMVDHLLPLVEKYERDLQVKVLHTRPAPGSLHNKPVHIAGGKHLLDVTREDAQGNPVVLWEVDTTVYFPSDLELSLATEETCVKGKPTLGSSKVTVEADLKPNSEYDLLLNAAPKVKGAFPEVPVARSHFRTSRYHNPTEMLAALGFAPEPTMLTPYDAITTTPALSGDALRIGDYEIDKALKDFGMDPWPLPAGPRTTVIWHQPNGQQEWNVAAVLIEADEPVFRAGLKTGGLGEPEPPARLEVGALEIFKTHDVGNVKTRTSLGTLTEQVRNAAGTRLLFRPNATIKLSGGRLYDLELRFKENGKPGAQGKAQLFNRPTIVAQES